MAAGFLQADGDGVAARIEDEEDDGNPLQAAGNGFFRVEKTLLVTLSPLTPYLLLPAARCAGCAGGGARGGRRESARRGLGGRIGKEERDFRHCRQRQPQLGLQGRRPLRGARQQARGKVRDEGQRVGDEGEGQGRQQPAGG